MCAMTRAKFAFRYESTFLSYEILAAPNDGSWAFDPRHSSTIPIIFISSRVLGVLFMIRSASAIRYSCNGNSNVNSFPSLSLNGMPRQFAHRTVFKMGILLFSPLFKLKLLLIH